MKKQGYYTIGEMSKICDVSISTLRYYDQKEVLKPVYTDKKTNYRYYSQEQILQLQIIKELRYRDFSLPRIKEYLISNEFNSIVDMYEEKKKEVEDEIENLLKIKDRLDNQLMSFSKVISIERNIDVDEDTHLEIKEQPARTIASIRKKTPFGFTGVSMRFLELFNMANSKNVSIKFPYLTIFHDDYFSLLPFYVDYEVGATVDEELNQDYDFITTIPEGLYGTTIIRGSYEKNVHKYKALVKWLKENNYKITGPLIKSYLTTFAATKSVHNIVCELQLPIEKI